MSALSSAAAVVVLKPNPADVAIARLNGPIRGNLKPKSHPLVFALGKDSHMTCEMITHSRFTLYAHCLRIAVYLDGHLCLARSFQIPLSVHSTRKG